MIIAEPSGGGGGGALVLGVALLAGFLFVGGGAALYLSAPQGPPATLPFIADNPSPSSSLEVFVQPTATPSPTPAPTFTPLFSFDLGSPSPFLTPSPTFEITPSPIVSPTSVDAPRARFSAVQKDGTLKVLFSDDSKGVVDSWLWNFGDGSTSTEQNPKHVYANPADYRVEMTVGGPGGTDAKVEIISVAPPATPTPQPTPTPTPGVQFSLTCNWNDSNYTADCSATVNSGVAPYTYLWSVNNGTITGSDHSDTASFKFTGCPPDCNATVAVEVTDADGTTRTKHRDHTFPPPTPLTTAAASQKPQPTETPTPDPTTTPEPTPGPASQPTPGPTSDPTPEPTPEPTANPTASAGG